MSSNTRHSIGDDGSTEARLSRLEAGAASGDWLTGRVAAIDAHLSRNTKQLDALQSVVGAEAERNAEARELLREARDELRELRRERREDRAQVDAVGDKVAKLEAEAPSFVSSVPPGWRRVVAGGIAVLAVIGQIVMAWKAAG